MSILPFVFLIFLAMLYKLELKIVKNLLLIGCRPKITFSLEMAYWQVLKRAWLKQTHLNGANIPNSSQWQFV